MAGARATPAPALRIGVITTSYPRHDGDAAGSFVVAHVRALRELGHDVDVIAAGAQTTDGVQRVPGALFYGGGAPDALERLGLRALPEAAAFTARLTAAVARRSRARSWDAAIAHWLAPSAIAAVAALPRRVPLLAIGHGGDVHTLRRAGLLAPVLHALRARGAKLAVVSEELRVLCAPTMAAVVQPMGIDVPHFAAIGRAPTIPPTVAFIGRSVPVKGVDVLFAAMPRVERATRLSIASERTFAERDQLLREASVIVIPSRVLPNGRSEGTPLVALEALAAGVPVVASAVGGLVDLPVTLVPPEDPGALAAAIERVLAAPPPRVDMSAYDWRTVVHKLTP